MHFPKAIAEFLRRELRSILRRHGVLAQSAETCGSPSLGQGAAS
jgi:hypothetical protein